MKRVFFLTEGVALILSPESKSWSVEHFCSLEFRPTPRNLGMRGFGSSISLAVVDMDLLATRPLRTIMYNDSIELKVMYYESQ
jgi:hypothetical protein